VHGIPERRHWISNDDEVEFSAATHNRNPGKTRRDEVEEMRRDEMMKISLDSAI
jgi:hypothetical protein